ncbi:MAG: hypothetical protein VXZ40_02895 [Nanoarchaeota archaeon]|nr:hypothetical protein [Nanoarchaeota archaeon]
MNQEKEALQNYLILKNSFNRGEFKPNKVKGNIDHSLMHHIEETVTLNKGYEQLTRLTTCSNEDTTIFDFMLNKAYRLFKSCDLDIDLKSSLAQMESRDLQINDPHEKIGKKNALYRAAVFMQRNPLYFRDRASLDTFLELDGSPIFSTFHLDDKHIKKLIEVKKYEDNAISWYLT